ncbi:MAG: YfgM family protein [Gammaproteobacteria bacterium]
MVDIYASEEEQVAAIKKWWKENGTSIILGLVIGSAALFGWRAWQGQITAKGEKASLAFSQLENQLANQKVEDANVTGKMLLEEYATTPYASFAALKLAKIAVEADDLEMAATQLQWVIDNGNPEELKPTAIMRLAKLRLSTDNLDSAWTLISSLDETTALSSYHELKGDILLAQGKHEEARNAYLQATALSPSGPGSNKFLEMKMDDLGR